MNNINTKHRVITALALLVSSHQLSAFDFGPSEKYSAIELGWRIEHATGRVSRCEQKNFHFEREPMGGKVTSVDPPKCTSWSKAIGSGDFRLAKAYQDDITTVFVIESKTGRVAQCILWGGDIPVCSKLSKE